MDATDFEEYRAARLAEGFDEVAERAWSPNAVAGHHSHPFAVEAIVVQGDMWLTVDDSTRHLVPGDRFELGPDVPHAERYGESGATYWAARKYGASLSKAVEEQSNAFLPPSV